jgi:hypothetical protein
MLQQRRFSPDLNLRRGAMLCAPLAYSTVGAVVVAPWAGPAAIVVAGASGVAWLALNVHFLDYVRRHWSPGGAVASGAMLFLYFLYGPLGLVLGVVAHALRGRRVAQLNWLGFERLDAHPHDVEVTVAVISAAEDLSALENLPPPASWWELIVVSRRAQAVPDHATLVLADVPDASRNQMRQQALDIARGEMFATLDASCRPDPVWLDRLRAAGKRSELVVAGSFHHDRRSARHRAAQVARYFHWRPELRPGWSTDHPLTNVAFRTDITKALGGFKEDGAILFRLAGFGARPVRFDPEMGVRLTGTADPRVFVRGVGGRSRLRAASSARYFALTRSARAVFALATPFQAIHELYTIMRKSIRERTADRTFWLGLPLIVASVASHYLGRFLGLARPRQRGGLVPRSTADLESLAGAGEPVAAPGA